MGRKPKTLEQKRIIYSTTLSPEIARQIDDLNSPSPTSKVISQLIEDGLKSREPGVKLMFPIKEAVYDRIVERMQPNENFIKCTLRLLCRED